MTTTVPQMPQAPQKTQPPQGAPSFSVNNPAFNSQQVAQSAVHPAQFAQPVYVLPEQENTHSGLDYCDGLGHYRCSWAD